MSADHQRRFMLGVAAGVIRDCTRRGTFGQRYQDACAVEVVCREASDADLLQLKFDWSNPGSGPGWIRLST